MHVSRYTLLAVLLTLMLTPPAARAAELVADTDPLTPQQQLTKFHLPPGFEIQLVASEPQINKPMNLNFDARGRLWVTSSVEYPHPAKSDADARDRITILADLGPDGTPAKIHDFATNLNIPIGVLPLGDGSEAIVWSIPAIFRLTDTDNDGVADDGKPLLTGFQFVDTHGNQNGFTRWLDGWVYANHGFRNHSKVKLGDDPAGPVVMDLPSGNTYRFKPDGSAAEQLTHGQVNPFGVAFDEWGYRYVADCHSMPVYQLINGAHYPSFGRPHDGLGFGPKMIDHNHGSSGIGGIAIYHADHFPPDYRGNLFLGNVVTGKVHRDVIEWRGSTPHAVTQPDFVTCDDPWFHPVDIQLGPDGALYIADFYAPIIGHYEVPLNHPKRDRTRGRIWRVVWKGLDGKAEPPKAMPDLTKLDFDRLFELFELTGNQTARTLMTHELVRRFPKESKAEAFGTYMSWSGAKRENPKVLPSQAYALWLDYRVSGSADVTQIQSPEPMVLAAGLRVMAANDELDWPELSWVRERLNWNYEDLPECAHVRRAAVEALARHPHIDNVAPLLQLWADTPSEDTHLIHATRIALREHLRDADTIAAVAALDLADDDRRRLVEIAYAVPTDAAAVLIFDYARQHDLPRDRLAEALPRVARHIRSNRLHELTALIQERYANDPAAQLELFLAIEKGLQHRGLKPDDTMLDWISRIVTRVLGAEDEAGGWTADGEKNPWGYQERQCADGQTAEMMSSHPHGEQLTGVLRSPIFKVPATLSFYLCGHNGYPGKPDHGKNRIRLRLVDEDKLVAEQTPPRNDTAQKYTWNLAEHAGRRGVIEVVDGDADKAYAWLAFGRLEPAVVPMPVSDPAKRTQQLVTAYELIGRHTLDTHITRVWSTVRDRAQPSGVRAAAAAAGVEITLKHNKGGDVDKAGWSGQALLESLAATIDDTDNALELRLACVRQIARLQDAKVRDYLVGIMAETSQPMQQAVAESLAATRIGAEELLLAIDTGRASPRLLTDKRLVERLRATGLPDLDARVAKLTAGLIPEDQRLARLIAHRRDAFDDAPRDPAAGRDVFMKTCAACHQINNQGARVGPSLDGIGVRGLDRLLEDVIDPNRNIDAAFKLTIVTTNTGQTHVGLGVREEGASLILVDTAGKEHHIPLNTITNQRTSNMSLMPPGLVDAIPETDFHNLIAYLLSQRDPANN